MQMIGSMVFFLGGGMNFDDQESSGRTKTKDSEAVLQPIEANSASYSPV